MRRTGQGCARSFYIIARTAKGTLFRSPFAMQARLQGHRKAIFPLPAANKNAHDYCIFNQYKLHRSLVQDQCDIATPRNIAPMIAAAIDSRCSAISTAQRQAVPNQPFRYTRCMAQGR